MPNNCNSIFDNRFYLILLCGFLYSCAINEASPGSYDNYSGKILIQSSQNQTVSYNSNIIIYKNRSIIQITKPFIGNVMNINIYKNKPAEIYPREINSYLDKFLDDYGGNANEWLNQCVINKNNLNISKENFSFYCSNENGESRIRININLNEITVILLQKDK
jgi:hypothetical protein